MTNADVTTLANVIDEYHAMIARCADVATTQLKGLACQGIVGDSELYYGPDLNGKMGLWLVPLACTAGPADSRWIATGRIMPCSEPYPFIARWVKAHSGDLPLFT